MELEQLTDYRYWIGKSPVDVRDNVRREGGWSVVFSVEFIRSKGGLPWWANRIRNYFNETPDYLRLLDRRSGSTRKGNLRGPWSKVSLSDHVYEDRQGRSWFQMMSVGAIYHYEGDVGLRKKSEAALSPPHVIPVFKLISPDGTGGSMEIIVHNWQRYRGAGVRAGRATIGKVGEWVRITNRIVLDHAFGGSYNYSETVVAGYEAHRLRDVIPHERIPKGAIRNFYIYPRGPIHMRRFPRYVPWTENREAPIPIDPESRDYPTRPERYQKGAREPARFDR